MNYALSKSITEVSSYFLIVILTLIALTSCASNEAIKPFTTDGCSNFPEGTRGHKDLWLRCCTEHDIAYWQGGSYRQRLEADLELKQCVSEVGKPVIAKLMLAGVRVGGSPYWPTEFRWGYGWPYLRNYRALTPAELGQVEQQLLLYRQSKGWFNDEYAH